MAETSLEPGPGAELLATLVAFSRELREAGLPVGTDDAMTFAASMEPLDPTDLLDLYWAGRVTLVTRRDHLPTYHRVFCRFFLGQDDEPGPAGPFTPESRAEAQAVLEVPETEPPRGETQEERETTLGLMASDAATLKEKGFAECTDAELAAIRRMMRTIRLTPPRRRTRRTRPHPRGHRLDLRRTVRETMRTHGEPGRLYRRERRRRPRPLVLVLDVSGSMADYSRHLLQFAHATTRATDRVEVFCFGTRLTRITTELRHRRTDDALDRAAREVVDWDGGTRIGECLDTFVKQWGRRGVGRGALVVICSDGLDRGDPSVLGEAMQRLSRLAHRVIWLNPHKGDDPDFQPSTLGMLVAAPYVDALLSGHDLASLEELAELLPSFG